MNIAILSPNRNSYSETFIQAQKEGLESNNKVFYYYDGFVPKRLENKGSIIIKFAALKSKLSLIPKNIRLESLKRSLKKNKINVVLAQYGPTGEAVAQLCRNIEIPLVVHFHGYDASVYDVIKRNNDYKGVFKHAKSVIVVSKLMKQDLINLGCDKNKIHYNPCVAHSNFYNVIPNFKNQQFISIGRFTDKKAPYYTILAFREVYKVFPKAKLVMAGSGELLNTCKNLVNYLGLSEAIKFPGVINRTEFLTLLEDSLAFVQHSITANSGDKEGTPVAIMEASAAGLPVISTYHAGIPDVIEHNKTGLLSDEHDLSSMTTNMIAVLRDRNYAKELGGNGKSKINEKFNMEKHIKKLENILFN